MQSETGIVDEERIATLGAALRVVGDDDGPERARLLAMQAAELMYSCEWDRRVQLSDEALTIARRLDDPDTLSAVLNMRFVTLLAPETLAERRPTTVEAVAAAERRADPMVRFYAYHWWPYSCIESGDTVRRRTWAGREQTIADRFRQPTTLWLAVPTKPTWRSSAGSWTAPVARGGRAGDRPRSASPTRSRASRPSRRRSHLSWDRSAN